MFLNPPASSSTTTSEGVSGEAGAETSSRSQRPATVCRACRSGRSEGDGTLPKPAEGSWTEHHPGLTGPVSYEDSISPEHYELERDAIFRRNWLNVGRVEQLPHRELLHPRAGRGTHVDRGPPGRGRRGAGVPQHLPAPGQQARVVGPPRRGDFRHLPPVHLQVPRVALRARRRADLRAAGGGVLRPRPCHPRAGAGPVRRVGGVRVRAPRPRQHDLAGRAHGRPRRRARRLPVPPDDPGAPLPRRGGVQLEALHRRVRGVLPRTRAAREASGGGRVAQARELRVRGVALRDRRAARDESRRGAACRPEGPGDGQADRAGAAQRAVRPVGPPRHRRRRVAPGLNPARSPVWGSTASCSSRTSCCSCGPQLVPHVPLLADLVPDPHLRGHALLRPADHGASGWPGAGAVTFKEYALQDGNTSEATQTMLESRGDRVPAQRPGGAAGTSTGPRAAGRPVLAARVGPTGMRRRAPCRSSPCK